MDIQPKPVVRKTYSKSRPLTHDPFSSSPLFSSDQQTSSLTFSIPSFSSPSRHSRQLSTTSLIFTPPPSSPPLFSDVPPDVEDRNEDVGMRDRRGGGLMTPSSPRRLQVDATGDTGHDNDLIHGMPSERAKGEEKNETFLFPSATMSSSRSRQPSQPLTSIDSNHPQSIIPVTPSQSRSQPRSSAIQVQSSLKVFFTTIPKPNPSLKRARESSTPSRIPLASSSSSVNLPILSSAPTLLGEVGSNLKSNALSKSLTTTISTTIAPKVAPKMTQLHLTHLPLLHTCPQCHMSFVRGGPDDSVHERHHVRIIRGIPWDFKFGKISRLISADVVFGEKCKGRGRIMAIDGSAQKLADILTMVDTVLSAPPLPPAILAHCKVFLFVTSTPPPVRPGSKRPRSSKLDGNGANGNMLKERIVGVVVAQGIKWAMRIIEEDEVVEGAVHSGDGVVCDPRPLPTPLGIHRLFTVPSYRSLGIAQQLLNAAAENTVYGCSFDPKKGQVAFSQPTASGKRAMDAWGKGGVRVFIDDERQL